MGKVKTRMPSGLEVVGDVLVTGFVDGIDISAHASSVGVGAHIAPGGSAGQFLNHLGAWSVPVGTYVHPAHTGDVTSTGDGATVIQNNKITASMHKGASGSALVNGSNGQVLTSNGDGTFAWQTLGSASLVNTTTDINDATGKVPTASTVKTAIGTLSAGIGTVHTPVADIPALKALTTMTDKQICLVENTGLYRFDQQDTVTAGDDNRVVTPTTASLGRWFKISATINDHANLGNIDKWGGVAGNTFHVPNTTGNGSQFLNGAGAWAIPAGTYVHPAHTGDVTSTGDGATVIQNNKITASMHKGASGSALANGSNGQVLTSNGDGTFAWSTINPSQVSFTHGLAISGSATNITSTPTAIDTLVKTTFRSVKWQIQVTDTTNSRYEMLEINATHDGINCYFTEFGNVGTATLVGATFTVAINGANVELQASLSGSASNTVKFIRKSINV